MSLPQPPGGQQSELIQQSKQIESFVSNGKQGRSRWTCDLVSAEVITPPAQESKEPSRIDPVRLFFVIVECQCLLTLPPPLPPSWWLKPPLYFLSVFDRHHVTASKGEMGRQRGEGGRRRKGVVSARVSGVSSNHESGCSMIRSIQHICCWCFAAAVVAVVAVVVTVVALSSSLRLLISCLLNLRGVRGARA